MVRLRFSAHRHWASAILPLLLNLAGSPAAQEEISDPSDLQAVVRTSSGQFVLEFYPDKAPNHVRAFLDLVQEGFYTGTTIYSMVPYGIVQAGDPITRERDRRSEYGTGGFNRGLEPEFNDLDFVEGTVVTTLLPGDPGSGGSQFLICVSDQPQLTGQFTAFGRVVEGLDVLREISETPTDEGQIALERVEVLGIDLRAIPPPTAPPFSEESLAELSSLSVIVETSMGDITLSFFPEVAPNHVRHFLRLASLGVYDRTAFHRIVPGFVVQGGDLNTRAEPYPAAAGEYVVPVPAELGDRPHLRGTLSMARGDALDSALTSFFLVLDDQPALDGVYTVFGEVVAGMDVVDRIAGVETRGETPLERVEVYSMRVERRN